MNHPAGTTFWLGPGTHTMAPERYAQVIPKSGNTYVGAPGAILDGKRKNAYAFTQKAANVTIKHLTIQNFISPGQEGVVNHDFGRGWVITRNTVRLNGGAGVIVGTRNRLSYNCLVDNGQYGFQGLGRYMVIHHNEVARNNTYDYERRQPGCGCAGGAKFWAAGPARVYDNYVHHNNGPGLWADTNNVGFLFARNYISRNRSHGIFYETSYNARIVDNTFRRNAIVTGREFQSRGDPFPVGAIYVSESGGESRVNRGVYSRLTIARNLFQDNWGGVVLWETGDRFCGSSANTSTGYCTLVNLAANLKTCADPSKGGKINVAPYRSDCRWKMKNVLVTRNIFKIDRTSIECTSTFCGVQAVFSNWSTVPSWSPYKQRSVQYAITFRQRNRFTYNRYIGTWRFDAVEAVGRHLTCRQWRSAPYNQDSGSTRRDAHRRCRPSA